MWEWLFGKKKEVKYSDVDIAMYNLLLRATPENVEFYKSSYLCDGFVLGGFLFRLGLCYPSRLIARDLETGNDYCFKHKDAADLFTEIMDVNKKTQKIHRENKIRVKLGLKEDCSYKILSYYDKKIDPRLL